MMISAEIDWEHVQAVSIAWGIKIVGAIVILLIGKWVARKITAVITKSMRKAGTDETLIGFANKLAFVVLMVFVVTASLSQLGVQTASMITIVGAAGLAIGLALQGALSNFAAGVLIIIFRPFKVGDLVDAGGALGVVRVIELFTTTVVTLDNKTAIIPNSQLTGDKILNYTETDTLRIDMVYGISYGDNIEKVKGILYDLMKADDRILKDPEPFVGVVEHGDSSINLVCRPWVKATDYWGVYFDMHEKVKVEFDKSDISIPFPQRDLHIISGDKEKISVEK